MLSKLQQTKLKKINKLLSKYGVEEIKEGISKSQIQRIKRMAYNMRDTVMESSEFNSYHKNEEYAVAILVLEAIEILSNPEDDSPYIDFIAEGKDQIVELEAMYESYVAKHGTNDKSENLKQRIIDIKTKIYESESSKKLNLLLKESAGKAQTIMSAKGLQDDMIDFQAKVGEIQNKYVDSFIAMVNDEYGADMASDIQSRLMDSLDELMAMVRKTKTDMLNIVNILSGNEVKDDESMVVDDEEEEVSLDSDDSMTSDDFELDIEDDSDSHNIDKEDSEEDSELDSDFERKV